MNVGALHYYGNKKRVATMMKESSDLKGDLSSVHAKDDMPLGI